MNYNATFTTVFFLCLYARDMRKWKHDILSLIIQQILMKFYIYLSRYSDWLRAGRSGDRIPMEARFSAPVQTGPGAHPASYTMVTVFFPGVKRLGRGLDHAPPSNAEVKERVELYPYSPSRPSRPVLGWTLPLPLQSRRKVVQLYFRGVCKIAKSSY
jgi:hypothetical protein